MANDITPYNNTWYAARALERLEKNLQFAKTVSRKWNDEPRRPGQLVEVRRPGGFVAQQYPTNTSQDLNPFRMQVPVDQYWHVTFGLNSQEKAYTGEQIISEHVAPAMQALAEQIETHLSNLILLVGNRTAASSPAVTNDLTAIRRKLNKRKVPRANRFLALSAELEEEMLNIQQYTNVQDSSDGALTQAEGIIRRKYGFTPYFQEILPSQALSTIAGTGTIALVGNHAKGVTSVTFNGSTSLTGIARKGFNFSIAGDTQQYAVAADATAAGNAITVTISPPLQIAANGGTVVTLGTDLAAKSAVACAYEQDAFMLVTSRLEDVPAGRGVECATMVDERINMGIRVLRWFDPMPSGGGAPSEFMKFEALWGGAVADPNRAERYEDV